MLKIILVCGSIERYNLAEGSFPTPTEEIQSVVTIDRLPARVVDVFGNSTTIPITDATLLNTIRDLATQAEPEQIVFITGSQAEETALKAQMVAAGILIPLNSKQHPNSYLHRSEPSDTARSPERTFVVCRKAETAGPQNNWMPPEEANAIIDRTFTGAMRGKTMYVVPGILGPDRSPYSQVALQVTDNPYVVVNTMALYGVGAAAYEALNQGKKYMLGVHATANLNPEELYILRFIEEDRVFSVNSAYGGNAILFKKAIGLGIASAKGPREGWLPTHMALIMVTTPEGGKIGIGVSKPSASGKTNDAMLISERTTLAQAGWKVETISDDIVYLFVGSNGELRAIPIERGFFGVAPGTSNKTNPSAMTSLSQDAIFTNVAVDHEGNVWWEGMTATPPDHLTDWKGRPWNRIANSQSAQWKITTPKGEAIVTWEEGKWQVVSGAENLPASEQQKIVTSHANARYTAKAAYCPTLAKDWLAPEGIPVHAIVFEGRRATTIPLVYEARNWEHGVFIGATLGAETTAAIKGKVGVLRRDPFAMVDFCTVTMGEHIQDWLNLGSRLKIQPLIFQKNSFRKSNGNFIWPGFAENLRVFAYIATRLLKNVPATETLIGLMPKPSDIVLSDLNVPPNHIELLFKVDRAEWQTETTAIRNFLAQELGENIPPAMFEQLETLEKNLKS